MNKLLIAGLVLLVVLVGISAIVAMMGSDSLPIGEKVALLKIEGPIVDSDKTIEELKGYADDATVKAIVVRVNSPGGAVAPSQEIYEEIKKAAETKKVVASMGAVAASGGYYIAVSANKIVANPGTVTGSIGVIVEVPNIEGLMQKVGIKSDVIKSGRHKDIASMFRTMTPEERALLQGVVDDIHDQFVNAVAVARKLPVEKVRRIADGRVFSGRQAKELGLVDELGDQRDAINLAAKLAGISGEPKVITKKEKTSLFEMLKGMFDGDISGKLLPGFGIKYMMVP